MRVCQAIATLITPLNLFSQMREASSYSKNGRWKTKGKGKRCFRFGEIFITSEVAALAMRTNIKR